MIRPIKNVLTTSRVQSLRQLIAHGQFEDGKNTAGWHAQGVKTNLQWQAKDDIAEELNHAVAHALTSNPEFTALTYPKKMMPFIVSKSTNQGGYGDHIDDAIMHNEELVRTDISCTIFLSDPNDYQGGELTMILGGVEMAYKLEAGDAIVYPSTTLHRVNPVTSGERLAVLTWIESLVSSPDKREILHDLDAARKTIMQQHGKTPEFDLITKSHANLLRRWAIT
ncbi:Fe2+-dependent dioxygenase [Parashewanella curva]|uniref:Fe2+-dependent dioxygenase n=1 Tax=Parashewanella curva TaxID=2338552 RepID=A0A3L8Q203_9GAMM|nr:Fe2+-dependent dioxygenase [Parashewanella curva]RLV60763.1 Fe2+-dependent dioxygenase [Parashewanella curva]